MIELLLGALVSGLVEGIKKLFGTKEYITLAIVALLSIAAAGAYSYFVSVGLWESFYQILVIAGAIYAYILRRVEK